MHALVYFSFRDKRRSEHKRREMWGRGFVHGLGGLGLLFGSGKLPLPRAVDGGVGEDYQMPAKSLVNFFARVALNQLVFGPIVIAIVLAWNSAWQGRWKALPEMYRTKAFPTLVNGWKFWTPVGFLNFGLVPLEARVAFMSTCAISWNFYLSSVVSKKSQSAKTR